MNVYTQNSTACATATLKHGCTYTILERARWKRLKLAKMLNHKKKITDCVSGKIFSNDAGAHNFLRWNWLFFCKIYLFYEMSIDPSAYILGLYASNFYQQPQTTTLFLMNLYCCEAFSINKRSKRLRIIGTF